MLAPGSDGGVVAGTGVAQVMGQMVAGGSAAIIKLFEFLMIAALILIMRREGFPGHPLPEGRSAW